MLLAELGGRKGERRTRKQQHSCTGEFRQMLQQDDQGRISWRGYSWQVHWRTSEGAWMRSVKGLRIRDTGETSRDTVSAKRLLMRARAMWNTFDETADEVRYPLASTGCLAGPAPSHDARVATDPGEIGGFASETF